MSTTGKTFTASTDLVTQRDKIDQTFTVVAQNYFYQ